jgi:acetylornithine deacetylase/succinyl-diaminopimelate desuccinylase-like protein
MRGAPEILERIGKTVRRQRLLETALRLIEVPSPTCHAGAVADVLAEMLTQEGFHVERPTGGWDAAPAVVVRHNSGRPGKTLQFDGHLDTVHLPFVPPAVDGDRLTGSGSSDMKAGVAAAVEALRVLREADLLPAGGVLFSAHDLHEAPWGDASQLNELIRSGICGDGVLIPEYTHAVLPIIGRGNAVVKITISRPGPPVHEVYRPREEPNVMAAGAALVLRFEEWGRELAARQHPLAGSESIFLGQFHCGEIYNQCASSCWLEGMLRWLPGHPVADIAAEYQQIVREVALQTGAQIQGDFMLVRDAFELDIQDPLVTAFQHSSAALNGAELPTGNKPFADDGSCFWQLRKVPCVTHGPRGGGAHTLNEWVSIDDLVRVAKVYAATAVNYCGR